MSKLLTTITLALSVACYAQIPEYQNRVNQITQTNINSYLIEFASYGLKKTGTVNNNNAFEWLKNKYTSFGYSADEISEDAFYYNGSATKNLVVTKVGTTHPNTFVIVCGHYDTIGGAGVNDNGSGVAVILEMARILKNVPTEYSIKFINFSGEEQGLLGSQHYVNTVVNGTSPKMDIKLVFNIDEVGGVAGAVNNTITCERDISSPTSNNATSNTVTQQLMTYVGYYSPLQTKLDRAYGSDYMPFQANNEVITGFYEGNESSYPHTSGDTLEHMDPIYLYNVAKAALGAVQHFSGASLTNLAMVECRPEDMLQSLRLYPNPADDYLKVEMLNSNLKHFRFSLIDESGKVVVESENQHRIDISNVPAGVYFGVMKIDDQTATRKVIVTK